MVTIALCQNWAYMLLAIKQLTNILYDGYTERWQQKKEGKTMHGKTTYNIKMVTFVVLLIGRN